MLFQLSSFYKEEIIEVADSYGLYYKGFGIEKLKDVNKNVQLDLADVHQEIEASKAAVGSNPNVVDSLRKIERKIAALSTNLNQATSEISGRSEADSRLVLRRRVMMMHGVNLRIYC